MKNFQQKSLDSDTKDLQLKAPMATEYMVPAAKLFTFRADTPVMEAINTLLENRITGAPVLNDKGEVIGLLDDKDCLNILVGSAYYNHPMERDTVATYMSNVMKSITLECDIIKVANIFMTTPYKRLLIMDKKGKLVGQISRRDILRAIRDMETNTW
jgi:predicted transcriptional regulator